LPLRKYVKGGTPIKTDPDWNDLIDFLGGPTTDERVRAVVSAPPVGKKRIKGIYWDPATEEVILDIEA